MALNFVPSAFVVEAHQAFMGAAAMSASSGYKSALAVSDAVSPASASTSTGYRVSYGSSAEASFPAVVDMTGYKTAFGIEDVYAPAASSLAGSPIMVGIGFSISQRPKRPVICYQGIYDVNVSATAIWPRCND